MHDRAGTSDLLCGGCGYNLRGVLSERCPECGRRFSPDHLIENLIPWEQRRHIGRLRAFWRTAWMATFRPRQLAAKLDRPIDRTAARMFHAWVVTLTIVTLLAGLWVTRQAGLWRFEDIGNKADSLSELLRVLLLNPWSLSVMLLAILAWLSMTTTLAGCWFHPRKMSVERQNRAVSIAHYTWAPLVWACALALALCGWTMLMHWWREVPIDGQAMLFRNLALALIVVQTLVWLWQQRRSGGKARINPTLAALTIALLVLSLPRRSIGGTFFVRALGDTTDQRITQLLIAIPALLLMYCWLLPIRLMKLTTNCGRGRTIAMAAALPVVWLTLLVTILLTAAGVYFIVAMMLAWR